MRIIVPIHRVPGRHAVSDETLCETVEDPRGRENLTGANAWKIHDHIKNSTPRRGSGVFVVMADPGVDTGRLLIVRVEILQTVTRPDAVEVIRRLALEAFGRL